MAKAKANSKMEKFQTELLQSLREYKAGKFARKTEVKPTDPLQPRAREVLPQSQR